MGWDSNSTRESSREHTNRCVVSYVRMDCTSTIDRLSRSEEPTAGESRPSARAGVPVQCFRLGRTGAHSKLISEPYSSLRDPPPPQPLSSGNAPEKAQGST
jgi:hypothetical protein